MIVLPKLLYSYDALEPYIDKETMYIHHMMHHKKYVDNANEILKNTKFNKMSSIEILKNLAIFPKNMRVGLQNNIGGHVNHSFFWKQFITGISKLSEELEISIVKKFSSFEDFKKKFTQLALSKFGSGWIWLVLDKNTLHIRTTSNQDNPLMHDSICDVSGIPVLGLDLWEHAYYLKYKNNRLEYINAFWKIVNWTYISEIFLKSI
ncbi:superoxide dismutase [Buchnera aphidicola]|uniref:superoxide dismutase n=1 Tax=Buchnera aphidicola TaxID=9 RepID=UPI003D18A617